VLKTEFVNGKLDELAKEFDVERQDKN